jgi:hypothetical protein
MLSRRGARRRRCGEPLALSLTLSPSLSLTLAPTLTLALAQALTLALALTLTVPLTLTLTWRRPSSAIYGLGFAWP